MKIGLAVFVVCALAGSKAFGDVVRVEDNGAGQVLTIEGQKNGLAEEIYSTLERAQIRSTRESDRTKISGKYISASSYGVHGDCFIANIKLTPDSMLVLAPDHPDLNATRITLSGSAAEELYDDLEMAECQRHPFVDGMSISGKNIVCSAHFPDGTYSCTLRATRHPIWW